MAKALGGPRVRRVGAALVVALGLTAYGEAYAATAGASEKPKALVTVAADRGAVSTQVGTIGSVEPAQTRSLSFPVSSTVTSISVRAGETVQAGQTLAEVDRTDAAQAVADDQNALDDAEQQLTDARDTTSPTSSTSAATGGGSSAACTTPATTTRTSASPTPRPSRSSRPIPSPSPSTSPTPSPTPSQTTSPTPSPSPSTSPTPTPTPSQTTSPTPSPSTSPTPTLTPSDTPSPTPSDTPSATPSPTPSETTSPTPSPSPTPSRTAAPSTSPTVHPSATAPGKSGGGTGSGSCSGRTGGGATSAGSGSASTRSGQPSGGQQSGGSDPILSAQQQVISDATTLDNAEDALAGATMTAPIAGKILSVSGTVGSQVSSGSTVITLADTADMTITADFPEADADHLAVGQSATVSLPADADQTYRATVTQVDPIGTSDGTMVRYGVLLSFVNGPADLLVGQSATVTVTTGSKTDVLRVPSTAVHDVAGTSGTVLENGAQVKVGVGLRGDQYTEITGGLAEGDRVAPSW